MKTKAETFMNDILIEYFNPKYIVAGSNHYFGYKKSGDKQFLKKYCRSLKFFRFLLNWIFCWNRDFLIDSSKKGKLKN